MKSMTGFGAGSAVTSRGESVRVEVRSVNHRFLDLKLSLPRDYLSLEDEVRERVRRRIERGRVEVWVGRTAGSGSAPRLEIDVPLARAWVDAWRSVQKKLGLPGEVDLGVLIGRTDVVRRPEPRPEEGRTALRRALDAALTRLDAARHREGGVLARDLERRIRRLGVLAAGMTRRAPRATAAARSRLEKRMGDLVAERADPARLTQEAALLAERSDVSEELVRLGSHLDGLAALIARKGAIGRRFEFLLQEVQREVNTLTSKSADLALTRLAVDAKAEIEKLREQIQNVE